MSTPVRSAVTWRLRARNCSTAAWWAAWRLSVPGTALSLTAVRASAARTAAAILSRSAELTAMAHQLPEDPPPPKLPPPPEKPPPEEPLSHELPDEPPDQPQPPVPLGRITIGPR